MVRAGAATVGISLVDSDEGHRRPHPVAAGTAPRVWVIVVTVLAAMLIGLAVAAVVHFLRSEWMETQAEQARWFVNEVKTVRPRLHP